MNGYFEGNFNQLMFVFRYVSEILVLKECSNLPRTETRQISYNKELFLFFACFLLQLIFVFVEVLVLLEPYRVY